MSSKDVVLIIVSGGDIASTNQADYLLEKFEWDEIQKVEGLDAYSYQNIRMWIHPDGVLYEDNLDLRWQKETGEHVCEAIFPSRHSAKSGNPSLTLHPIGVPQLDYDEIPPYGGKSGNAPPPSPRAMRQRSSRHLRQRRRLSPPRRLCANSTPSSRKGWRPAPPNSKRSRASCSTTPCTTR